MPWVRVDDHFDEHPKFAQAGPLGMALWLAGLAYCNRNLTDGFIPWAVAHRLVSWEFLGDEYHEDRGYVKYTVAITTGMRGDDVTSEFVVEQLVKAGLWEVVERGFMVHDYPDYQPTKEQVEEERAKKQAAGQAGGRASAQARAQAGGSAYADTDAQAKSKPVPKPVPVPGTKPKTVPSPPSLRSGGRAREELTSEQRFELIDKWAGTYGSEENVEAVIEQAMNHQARLKCKSEKLYVDGWLRRELKFQGNHLAAVHEPEGCTCAQKIEWLKVNRNTNPYCELHGDVRDQPSPGAA